MKNRIFIQSFIVCVVLLLSQIAQAGILEFQGEPFGAVSASGISVNLYRDAFLRVPELDATLFITGAGVRTKKVSFFSANVYIATSYIDLVEGIDPQDPMQSIERAKAKAVQMTFVRDVTAEQIKDGFMQSLLVNGIDPEDPPVKAILEKLDFDVEANQVFTISGYDDPEIPGLEHIYGELPSGGFIAEKGENLATRFWSCWFGIPSDEGLENLKEKLIGPVDFGQ